MFMITDKLLAGYLEIRSSANGKYYFKSADAVAIKTAMRVLDQIVNDDHYVIDIIVKYRIPYWVCVAIASALAPIAVSLLTPNYNQPVLIPHVAIPLMGSGGPINFARAKLDEFTFLQFSSPRLLPSEQINTIVPQHVNPYKGVVISSTAPPWIIATVALPTARWRAGWR